MNRDNNCVYCNKYNNCSILTVKKCIGEKCTFSKNKEQRKHSIKTANERLCSLSSELQNHISDQYYDGKMPWSKGEKNNE